MKSNLSSIDSPISGPAQATADHNCIQFPPPSSNPASESPKKRTPAQVQASRENGKLSNGPISVQGKLRSSKNSTSHGFTAARCSYSNQNYPGIQRIYRNLVIEFKPQTPSEHSLVDTMALARWQQSSIPQEMSALVNYTRDTQIANPNFPADLANAKAIEKQHQQGETLNHYHRYLKDAERRFYRAVRELNFIRLNSHALHELQSAAAHEQYESTPTSMASTLPINPVEPPEAVIDSENVEFRNDPEQFTHNKVVTISSPSRNEEIYLENTSKPTQNNANSPASKPLDPKDHWQALVLIQQTLIGFPEAHRAVGEALLAAENAIDPVTNA